MKITVCTLCFLVLFICTGFYFFSPEKRQPEKSIDQIIDSTAKIMEKKYNMYASGTGASMPNGVVKKLNLAFDSRQTFPKDELRKILIESALEMLNRINADEELQPFMETRPFTIKNVQIIIYNHNESRMENFYPEISTANITSGILTFRSYDPENEFKIKNELQEPYEEALHIYENQKLKSGNF